MPPDTITKTSSPSPVTSGKQILSVANNNAMAAVPTSSDGGNSGRAFGNRLSHNLRKLLDSAGSGFASVTQKKVELQNCLDQLHAGAGRIEEVHQHIKQFHVDFDASADGERLAEARRVLASIESDPQHQHGTPSMPSDVVAIKTTIENLESHKDKELSKMINEKFGEVNLDDLHGSLKKLESKVERLQAEIAHEEPTPENMLKKHEAMANQQMAIQASMTAVNNLQSMVTTVSQAQTAQIAALMNQILDDIKAINELMKKGGRTMTDAIG